ncbi:RNA-binding S4 domain-containing protein [Rathayibacter toxicus]|nr:RNA-binding S4 domain-containing protein [Rathayibacter toxicus]QWL32568.1 RNA-binding S4 domain-containing protein [Rathayibacter toxicus]QWL34663.1 RNA-binding S4 domain-containing protein [Rathayibacter toxicus]QWL36794.1 RNA-binding S4 domain-containing protein [Rathayibacter toxicus]QWL38885.1 RNA-binding S4 domain-containing protein [Rathayibacter toxicus]
MASASAVRVDAWLWAVRIYRTRSAATAAARAGQVRVNGKRAKAAQPVQVGDQVRARIDRVDRVDRELIVRALVVTRVSASAGVHRHGIRLMERELAGVRAGSPPPRRGSAAAVHRPPAQPRCR